ncbi:hypothetical protein [Eubacterium ventriosum]|jgi:hypothetical protein
MAPRKIYRSFCVVNSFYNIKKVGDENGKESTVNYRAGETYGMAG